MADFFEFMIKNKYFSAGLIVLLIILIVLFFVILFLGKETKVKTEKIKNSNSNDDQNLDQNLDKNIDFDYGEYVKETTAEFELTPVTDVEPTPDSYVPEVKEESPALKFDSKEEPVLKDFSFDELSKSISDELDKLKLEEEEAEKSKESIEVKEEEPVKEENKDIPEVKFVDSFKEITEEVKPVELPKVNYIEDEVKDEAPVFITDAASVKASEEIVLPKLANEEVVKKENNEPVIKENDVPLFQRFNQETYDLNQKD